MFIFRPVRKVSGKRIRGRFYSGRYCDEVTGKWKTVPLRTPDRQVAEKRLSDRYVQLQREREGFTAPKAQKDAAGRSLGEHLEDYVRDLKAQERDAQHVKDTSRRIERIVRETGWRVLGDVEPDSFTRWRSKLKTSAKTKKEYQVSMVAFLNWLVRIGRLAGNPLARVTKVEVRGKKVREPRSFSEKELARLFGVSELRCPVYQTLFYSGQRKEEARALVWGDIHYNENGEPFLLMRESTMKDKDKRTVPLPAALVAELLAWMNPEAKATDRIFFGRFPRYATLRRDLERAKIPHRDALGRVVHFHSFRKTFQTLGVRYNVNQRVAQEVLGHGDANMTAKAYTDVPALSFFTEMAKFPWIKPEKPGAQIDAHVSGRKGHVAAFPGKGDGTGQLKKAAGAEELSRGAAHADISRQNGEMVDATGLEPVTPSV